MGASGLGALLVDEGFLTEQDRKIISNTTGQSSWAFARGVLSTGLLDEEELASLLTERTEFPLAKKDIIAQAEPDALAIVPPSLIGQLEIFPISIKGDTAFVAVVDPLDKATIRQLEFFSEKKIKPVIATLTQINEAIKTVIPDFNTRETSLDSFLVHHASSALRQQRQHTAPQPTHMSAQREEFRQESTGIMDSDFDDDLSAGDDLEEESFDETLDDDSIDDGLNSDEDTTFDLEESEPDLALDSEIEPGGQESEIDDLEGLDEISPEGEDFGDLDDELGDTDSDLSPASPDLESSAELESETIAGIEAPPAGDFEDPIELDDPFSGEVSSNLPIEEAGENIEEDFSVDRPEEVDPDIPPPIDEGLLEGDIDFDSEVENAATSDGLMEPEVENEGEEPSQENTESPQASLVSELADVENIDLTLDDPALSVKDNDFEVEAAASTGNESEPGLSLTSMDDCDLNHAAGPLVADDSSNIPIASQPLEPDISTQTDYERSSAILAEINQCMVKLSLISDRTNALKLLQKVTKRTFENFCWVHSDKVLYLQNIKEEGLDDTSFSQLSIDLEFSPIDKWSLNPSLAHLPFSSGDQDKFTLCALRIKGKNDQDHIICGIIGKNMAGNTHLMHALSRFLKAVAQRIN